MFNRRKKTTRSSIWRMRRLPFRCALTLVELMISLAVTASIGTVTTTVVVAMMNCKQAAEQQYELSWASNIGLSQLEQLISRSQLVLGCSRTSILLWMEDTNHIGRVDLSELVSINYDASQKQLVLEQMGWDNGTTQANNGLDQHFAIADVIDWADTGVNFRAYMDISQSPLAVNVESISFTTDTSVPETNRVDITAVFQVDGRQLTLNGSSTLRSPVTRYLLLDSGLDSYILTSDYDTYAQSK